MIPFGDTYLPPKSFWLSRRRRASDSPPVIPVVLELPEDLFQLNL
jgi:hypothetical protein